MLLGRNKPEKPYLRHLLSCRSNTMRSCSRLRKGVGAGSLLQVQRWLMVGGDANLCYPISGASHSNLLVIIKRCDTRTVRGVAWDRGKRWKSVRSIPIYSQILVPEPNWGQGCVGGRGGGGVLSTLWKEALIHRQRNWF